MHESALRLQYSCGVVRRRIGRSVVMRQTRRKMPFYSIAGLHFCSCWLISTSYAMWMHLYYGIRGSPSIASNAGYGPAVELSFSTYSAASCQPLQPAACLLHRFASSCIQADPANDFVTMRVACCTDVDLQGYNASRSTDICARLTLLFGQ
jgi:hypothetical protein